MVVTVSNLESLWGLGSMIIRSMFSVAVQVAVGPKWVTLLSIVSG